MKRISSTVSSAVLATLITGTAYAESPATGQDYFWPNYQKQIQFKAKSHAIRGSIVMTPAKETRIGDNAYREITLTTQPSRLPGIEKAMLMRADKTGLYVRYSTDKSAPEVQLLALPAVKGKKWTTFDHQGKPSEREIESIGQCDIKGQIFDQCVRVSFQSPGGQAVAFYAPKFGEIVNSRKNGFLRRTIYASDQ